MVCLCNFCLLCFSGVRPELSAEDRRVLLKLERCKPERYSDLIQPWELVRLELSPPGVALEAPTPLSAVCAEETVGSCLIF